MSLEKVRDYLKGYDKDLSVIEMEESTATVSLAAQALGTEEGRIAKSLTFKNGKSAMIVVAAGDGKVDNKKFKREFGFKAKMLSAEDTLKFTGHPVGGVCPFDIPEDVDVFLDRSLKRFTTVFPACGSSNSAVELELTELEELSHMKRWVDVCRVTGE